MGSGFIGVDMVHIPGFSEQLHTVGSQFSRSFSPRELRIASTKPLRDAHLAGRYAVKEAFIKAWSQSNYGQPPTIDSLDFSDIEVVVDVWGRPRLELQGRVAEVFPSSDIQISISHDGDYATAICLINL
ncbi:holo-ACP synthase [Corynebacterium sp. ES2730-CONJ]|uniref:holo-ACP synthase AcpS n=1 Tax=Corynebacterium sp. ES2730-CONJ TaxID=2973941 RepID=UPI00216AF7D0|nr:holo-ACP synthase [Corynebacterium sp. ES2730-CONJ]MCS4532567.1 holo-ACP synthase [Corynebacterium sp. ES2730-CONJ]